MFNTHSPDFLRRVLIADAMASGATGLLLAIGADWLEPLLGLPSILTREAGIILLPFALLVAWIGTRKQISRRWVWAVIACNALWVIDSAILLLSGWVVPTMLGTLFVVAQAVVVAVLAELEWMGLRQPAAAIA